MQFMVSPLLTEITINQEFGQFMIDKKIIFDGKNFYGEKKDLQKLAIKFLDFDKEFFQTCLIDGDYYDDLRYPINRS